MDLVYRLRVGQRLRCAGDLSPEVPLLPMANSPPGIQTMPGGAGADGLTGACVGTEITTVGLGSSAP